MKPPPSDTGRGELDSQGGKGPQSQPLRPNLNQGSPRPPGPWALGVSSEQRRQLGAHGSCISWLRLLGGFYVTRERGRDTDEETEICQSVGDELQEMLLSKNMPFLKGKQSLEGVRSPRGEESKTVRLTGRPVEQQRSTLPTHFLCD